MTIYCYDDWHLETNLQNYVDGDPLASAQSVDGRPWAELAVNEIRIVVEQEELDLKKGQETAEEM